MKTQIKVLLVAVFCAIFSTSVYGNIINVPDDQPTIQAAIDVAIYGDTILVAAGTYVENINFLGKKIVVTSSDGPKATTIQAPATGLFTINTADNNSSDTVLTYTKTYTVLTTEAVVYLVTLEPRGTELSGFTIKGGGNSGIYCDGSSPRILNNIITGNASIQLNTAGGINLINTSGALIRGNIIYGNNAHTYGAALHARNSIGDTICYNITYYNSGIGDFRCLNSTSAIFNNTLNCFDAHDGVMNQLSGTIDVRNNIIIGAPYVGVYAEDGGQAIISYNCIWLSNADCNGSGITVGPGRISADPLFFDANNHDYALSPGSPCIDMGDPDPFFNDPDGSRNDMGALRLIPSAYPIAANINYGPDAGGEYAPTLTPEIFWTYIDTTPTTQWGYEIEIGTDEDWTIAEMWATGPVASSDTSVVYTGSPMANMITYYLRLRVDNGANWGDWSFRHIIPHTATIINVPDDHPTIQAAIDFAIDGDTVLVATGSYFENIDFLGKSIRVIGDGAATTFLQPLNPDEPAITMASIEGSGAEFSGFSVAGGGNAHTVVISASGSPLICYNVFHDNIPVGGNSIAVITCSVSAPVISHNVFYNNGGIGCVAIMGGTAEIINNTFDGNARGLTALFGSGIAKNNIVTNSLECGIESLHMESDYNNVWNNNVDYHQAVAGPGDISSDPLYVDPLNRDYNLQPGSPCIDAGDPDPYYNDPDGTRNDMGAFPTGPPFLCGDADGSRSVNILDVAHLIRFLYKDGPAPVPYEAGDADGSGNIDLMDITYLVNYLYKGGPAPICPEG